MTAATLMNLSDPWFSFDHAMSHRTYFGVMAPLTRFSVLPYLPLNPMLDESIPSGWFNLTHQHAHDDVFITLPTYYGSLTIGIPNNQILVETDLANKEQALWWQFLNLTEHQIADSSILPALAEDLWTFPFW